MLTDSQIIDGIITQEGSRYTDTPGDAGGPTKYGITLVELSDWRRSASVLAADVQALTETEARQIYQARYVAPFAAITNQPLRVLCIDTAVNSGVAESKALLQKSLGLVTDGVLGPRTVAAANAATSVKPMVAERIIFDLDLAIKNKNDQQFIRGWVVRCLSFI